MLAGVGILYLANIAQGSDWGIEQERELQQSQKQSQKQKTDFTLMLEKEGIDLNTYSKNVLYMEVPEEGKDILSTSTLVLYKNKEGAGSFVMYRFKHEGFDGKKETIEAFDLNNDGLVGLTDQNGKTDNSIDNLFVTRMEFTPTDCIKRAVDKDDPLYEETYKKMLEIYAHLGEKSRKILTDEGYTPLTKR